MSGASAKTVRGKAGDRLERGEGAGGGGVGEGFEGAAHFGEGVGEAAVGAEFEMARTGAGRGGDKRRGGGRERRGGGVEGVGENFVEPEVAHDDVAVVGRDGDGVGVGGVLTFGVGAVAGVLDFRGRSERAVGT